MNKTLWRVEVLRARRTHSLAITAAICVLIGVGAPFMALYGEYLIAELMPEAAEEAPPLQPLDGLGAYVDNVTGPIIFAIVLISAAALSFDGNTGKALFYRTRVKSVASLVLPRYTVAVGIVVLSYSVGLVAAWVSTNVVLGALPWGSVLLGATLFSVHVAYVAAVVVLAAGFVRHILAVLGISAALLAVVALMGQIPLLSPWTPSALVGAQHHLVAGGQIQDFFGALAVTLALIAVCLSVGVARSSVREL